LVCWEIVGGLGECRDMENLWGVANLLMCIVSPNSSSSTNLLLPSEVLFLFKSSILPLSIVIQHVSWKITKKAKGFLRGDHVCSHRRVFSCDVPKSDDRVAPLRSSSSQHCLFPTTILQSHLTVESQQRHYCLQQCRK
jgi:hypothetical protein